MLDSLPYRAYFAYTVNEFKTYICERSDRKINNTCLLDKHGCNLSSLLCRNVGQLLQFLGTDLAEVSE